MSLQYGFGLGMQASRAHPHTAAGAAAQVALHRKPGRRCRHIDLSRFIRRNRERAGLGPGCTRIAGGQQRAGASKHIAGPQGPRGLQRRECAQRLVGAAHLGQNLCIPRTLSDGLVRAPFAVQ